MHRQKADYGYSAPPALSIVELSYDDASPNCGQNPACMNLVQSLIGAPHSATMPSPCPTAMPISDIPIWTPPRLFAALIAGVQRAILKALFGPTTAEESDRYA